MSSNNRRVGRECALKILFALKLDDQADAARLLNDFWQNFRFADDVLGEPLETVERPLSSAAREFAETLVRGVCLVPVPERGVSSKEEATNI